MKYAAVLDIGSSKVVSICAGRVGKDGMAVYGADIRTYSGYRGDEFVDEQDLRRTIHECIEATERECGFRIREIAISVPAPFSKLHVGTGTLDFEEKPRRIGDREIDELINESLPPEEEMEGYSLMHSTPYHYVVDGADMADIPDEAPVKTIEAWVSHYYARDSFLELVYSALKEIGVGSICVSAMLAEALLLIPERERIAPAVLLDVGYAHTDVCVVQHAAVVAQETIGVGGYHFANDLAYGLEVGVPVAELAKRRYVFGLDYQDSMELLRTPEGTKSVERSYIQYIIESRARELCDIVYDTLREVGIEQSDKPAVYLTGGGISMMRGSREYLEHMLGMRISKDMPWMPRMNTPNYASAFGVLEFVIYTGGSMNIAQPAEVGVLQRLKDFFIKS